MYIVLYFITTAGFDANCEQIKNVNILYCSGDAPVTQYTAINYHKHYILEKKY